MNGLVLMVVSLAAFAAGYVFYSRFLARRLGVDPERRTPAHAKRDDVDYVPASPTVLFGHHFAAIAGAGPIVGPVLAAEFGWAAVALWVVLGCVFIGAGHDMIALFLSVRNEGKSIGTVIGSFLGRPGKIMFLVFSWSVLVLVVAEFTRQIAGTFVSDPAIATSSMLFILDAVAFGLCVCRFRMSVRLASFVFVPLMFVSVWIGEAFPLDLVAWGLSVEATRVVWIVVLLAYCFLASVCPVWVLLQPRGYLSSYLLYVMMALGLLGVFVAHPALRLPAFAGFEILKPSGVVDGLFPILFVVVSCGACSGTHAIIASGTTSKQLADERHMRPVAYGGMLLEGVLAIVAIVAVAGTYATQGDYLAAVGAKEPAQLFASSVAGFCSRIGIPMRLSEGFILLSISAFLMTTVDACARLARFSWQELVGRDAVPAAAPRRGLVSGLRAALGNSHVATTIVCLLAAELLLGNAQASKSLWTILASANQLIAALTLLTATMWFARNRRPSWLTAIPLAFMTCVSTWALWAIFRQALATGDTIRIVATGYLLLLAALLISFGTFKLARGRVQAV